MTPPALYCNVDARELTKHQVERVSCAKWLTTETWVLLFFLSFVPTSVHSAPVPSKTFTFLHPPRFPLCNPPRRHIYLFFGKIYGNVLYQAWRSLNFYSPFLLLFRSWLAHFVVAVVDHVSDTLRRVLLLFSKKKSEKRLVFMTYDHVFCPHSFNEVIPSG